MIDKLDIAENADVSLYQEICMLLAHQINEIRSQCRAMYSRDKCIYSLDKR